MGRRERRFQRQFDALERLFPPLRGPMSTLRRDSWFPVRFPAALVLIVELLNSAIESTVDRISMEYHELSKRAKDLGSAAVMLSLLLCTAIWACAAWVRFSS